MMNCHVPMLTEIIFKGKIQRGIKSFIFCGCAHQSMWVFIRLFKKLFLNKMSNKIIK